MIVAHYRHRHHAKHDHSVTEIVPTDKLPRTGIGNCGHRPSDLIFSKWPRRGAVAFGRAPTLPWPTPWTLIAWITTKTSLLARSFALGTFPQPFRSGLR